MRVRGFPLVLVVLGLSGGSVVRGDEVSPFTAQYDNIKVLRIADGTETTERDHGRVCRDSRGRMRYDFTDEDVRLAFLVDTTTHKMVLIEAESGQRIGGRRVAGVRVQPTLTRRHTTEDPRLGSEQFAVVDSSALGERTIEGLVARGHRTRLANGSVTEVWHSASLPDMPIVSTATGPSGREESRLHDIQIGEPDPQLFSALEGDIE